MNTWRTRRTGVITLAVLAAIATSAACGGGAASDSSASPASTSASAPAPSSASGGAAAPAAAAPATGGADPLLARGKVIFEKEAGGVGCAACHGMDGKGNGPAGVSAPPNRGASEDLIREKLGSVELMSIVKLKDEDIKAVAAYLAYLGKQP